MAKLRAKQSDRLANGLILLIFGFLFLLIQLRITDHWLWLTYIKTPATFFFIAGAIYLWLKRERFLGYILTGIGLMGYSIIAFEWTKEFTQYTFPLVVMISGISLIHFARFK
ncbi:MAG: hypothetical protein PHI32_05085 [Dysgonamonadaceae bacterium]|nr:hypothetical protein [Dysgonamonadaceae bacterium]